MLLLLGGALFARDGTIPSAALGDTALYFAGARGFAAEQLRAGNLPLWNPHVFSGTPFLGVFQSSVLYPVNLLYLVLPLARALSVEMALHLLLLGLFTLLWLRGNGLHPLACFAGAATTMLSAPSFLRLLAGQLTVLDTFAWVPLLLLVVDRLGGRVTLGWLLTGIGTVSMMILAGHPPTLLMAAIAVALYALPRVLASSERMRLAGALALLALAPVALTAAQVFTGVAVATETVRGTGSSFAAASAYSFPPESLLTLVAWDAFGTAPRHFFGRWFYWDASAYVGVVACCLAMHGVFAGEGRLRRVAMILAPLLLVLALGASTPFYQIVHALPGFGFVRAPSKFLFFSTLFGAALVAIGVERLLDDRQPTRRVVAFALVLAALLVAAVIWVKLVPAHAPGSLVALLASLNPSVEATPPRLAAWRETLVNALAVPALLATGVAALLWHPFDRRGCVVLLVTAASLELLAFAWLNARTTRVTHDLERPGLIEAYQRAGESRVLESGQTSNVALQVGGYNLWGYDPLVLRRYAELVARTQGVPVEAYENTRGLCPLRYHRLLQLLRVEYTVMPRGRIFHHPNALPRLLLVGAHRVVGDADAALAALETEGFDPRRTVILEQAPDPPPDPAGTAGTIEVLDESTDHVTLEVDLPAAAVLLMTDAYSRGWRAVALPGSARSAYALLPADYAMRAVPLSAGRHRLRIEYAPRAYHAGLAVSGLSLVAFAAALGTWYRRR